MIDIKEVGKKGGMFSPKMPVYYDKNKFIVSNEND
jgi:hypothetical protein